MTEPSLVEQHRQLTGGRSLLTGDPVDVVADAVLSAALETGSRVKDRTIAKVVFEAMQQPGTVLFEAAFGLDFDRTKSAVAERLEALGRADLIGKSLRALSRAPTQLDHRRRARCMSST